MSKPVTLPPHHLFHHEAMKTTFYLRICGDDEPWLRGLACECFELIDELERKLSRYLDGGDVARINAMSAGETLHVSEECHECLLVAMEACIHTGGLFDPTLGALIEHRKTKQGGTLPEPVGQLVVHPDTAAVSCDVPGRVIDLGGIGKGYALDCLARFLTGWRVEGALLSSGASTHLAIGPHTWPMDLTGDDDEMRIYLRSEALSASGTAIQGSHIIHPAGEGGLDESQPNRIWARSPSAAQADAWSTALMLMTQAEIHTAPSEQGMLSAVYIEGANGFRVIEA